MFSRGFRPWLPLASYNCVLPVIGVIPLHIEMRLDYGKDAVIGASGLGLNNCKLKECILVKKIGMIGGFGPESTREYYRLIIDPIKQRVNTPYCSYVVAHS